MKEQTKLNMMKWTVFLGHIICVLIFIQLVSAEIIYAGESKTFNLPETPDKCEFSGNTYNLDGINFTINGNKVTITIAPNFKSDNLTLKCFIGEEEPVWYTFGSGGGSSSSTTTITEDDGDKEEVQQTKEEEIFEQEEEIKRSSTWIVIGIILLLVIAFIIVYKLVKKGN